MLLFSLRNEESKQREKIYLPEIAKEKSGKELNPHLLTYYDIILFSS